MYSNNIFTLTLLLVGEVQQQPRAHGNVLYFLSKLLYDYVGSTTSTVLFFFVFDCSTVRNHGFRFSLVDQYSVVHQFSDKFCSLSSAYAAFSARGGRGGAL